MSALERLRNRLHNIPDHDPGPSQMDTGETTREPTVELTAEVTDNTGCTIDTIQTSWSQRIKEGGNKAEDWLEFTNYMKNSAKYRSEKTYMSYVNSLYARAIKAINVDEHKNSVAYAQLLINCANFKRSLSVEDARSLMQYARNMVKKLAIVYVASAELEVSQANPTKAKRLLEKGQQNHAQPEDLIKLALQNLLVGKTPLIPDQKPAGTDSNKENAELPNRIPASAPASATAPATPKGLITDVVPSTVTMRSRRSNSNLLPDKASIAAAACKVEVKKPFYTDSVPRLSQRIPSDSSEDNLSINQGFRMPFNMSPPKLAPISSTAVSNSGGDSTISFLHGEARRVRSQSGHHSDDGDTIPVSLDDEKGLYKRSMKSYHSTPDCKQPGILSASNVRKPRNLGMPMRVKRTSLPQLREGSTNNDDDTDDFKLSPLPETDIFNNAMAEENIRRELEISRARAASRSNDTIESHEGLDKMEDGAGQDGAEAPFEDAPAAASRPGMEEDMLRMDHAENDAESEDSKKQDTDSGVVTNSPEMPAAHFGNQSMNNTMNKSTGCTSSTLKAPVMPGVSSNIMDHDGASQPISAAPVTSAAPAKPTVAEPQLIAAPPVQPMAQPMVQPMIPTGAMQVPMAGSAPTGYVQTPNRQMEVLTIRGKVYQVLKMLGRGGSSKVYETLDHNYNLRAVKCVNLDGADDATIESYKNEIKLLKRLQHSSKVIRLFDYEYLEADNVLYVVMERGDTDLASLFRQCNKSGGIDSLMQKFYWKEMLKAVQVLHKEGIVHSDLKPANFLLVSGNLKLIDFGIAKALHQDMTSVTCDQQVGTLNYMSPEAIIDTCGGTQTDAGGRVVPKIKLGVKSDVWSLGCILYNLVYGKTPFHHIANNFLKLQAITNPKVEINFPEKGDSGLKEVLSKCLRRDPRERPSISELLAYNF